jgi:hypothetical protein
MKINDKTFISLIRQIIRDTEVDATNNERNILRIARNRATPKPSRTYVKSLLQKYTDEYWRVEISEDGNTAIYTNKMLLDPPRGYVFTEGEI